jgi:hypothetical protein
MMDNSGTKLSTYGIGLFSIALLSRWSTGNILFTGTEGLLRFGIIEVLAFSLAGFMAFITMIPIARRVTKETKSFSLLEILENRLNFRAYWWMRRLLLLGLFFNLCLLGNAVGILLYSFSIPVYAGMSLFFFAGFLLVIFLKWKQYIRYSMLKVGILFLLIIMVLVHSYLLEGVQVVYDGIRLYHPYLLFIAWRKFPLLFLSYWCVLFGILIADFNTWSVLLNHKGDKKELGLLVTGFLWGTIPFSFALIALSAIYLRGFDSVLSVFKHIFVRYDNWVVTLVLISLMLLILMGTFFSSLRTLFNFYAKKSSRYIWIIGIIFVVVIPFVVKLFSLSILDLFFLSGSFFAACVPVLLHLLWKKNEQGMGAIITIFIASVTGWIFYFSGIYQYSVLYSFLVAIILIVVRSIIGKR